MIVGAGTTDPVTPVTCEGTATVSTDGLSCVCPVSTQVYDPSTKTCEEAPANVCENDLKWDGFACVDVLPEGQIIDVPVDVFKHRITLGMAERVTLKEYAEAPVAGAAADAPNVYFFDW